MDEETKKYIDSMINQLTQEFNYVLGPRIKNDMENVQKRVSELEKKNN